MKFIKTAVDKDTRKLCAVLKVENCSDCPWGDTKYMAEAVRCEHEYRSHEVSLIGRDCGIPKNCPLRCISSKSQDKLTFT